MNKAIVLEGIRKSFGSRQVLTDITGEIERGKIVGLLGKNGEGKTTLFRILLDILLPDSGRVMISGRVPDGTGRIRESVGYVPERPTFHPFMSVAQVFALRAKLFPRWNREIAAATAQKLELDLQTKVKDASKGTLAKIAWVCATAHSPEVLLLDEPTSGLDALVRDSVLAQLVNELAEEGKTIFVSNHRMEELSNILDEVWVLHSGKIVRKENMEALRASACRLTGRLRQSSNGRNFSIFEEYRSGDLVSWLVLDPQIVEQIRGSSILEQMQQEPLPAEKVFKVLLRQGEKA
jgi:ABC-2 type transport system ATP-binding protein